MLLIQASVGEKALGEEEAGRPLVDDDPVVFQVEFDAPLLEGIGSEDDLDGCLACQCPSYLRNCRA